jgi:hypothetical protein
MTTKKKSLSRRLGAAALLATLLATGAASTGVAVSAQADGLPRCCF